MDAQKLRADAWGHSAEIKSGALRVGDVVSAEVDAVRREDIARAHSATHLMHSALRIVLGGHVEQRGSLVEAGRLRFDFSHGAAVSAEELREAERIVNEQVRRNAETQTETLSYDDAVGRGATALFGEKYGDIVRMVTIGAGYSVELCGGTHARRAGDIGLFRFAGESAIAAGIRRVEAVAGGEAVLFSQEESRVLLAGAALLKSPPGKVAEKISQLQEERKNAERELEKLRAAQTGALAAELAAKAERMGGGERFGGEGCGRGGERAAGVGRGVARAAGVALRDISGRGRGDGGAGGRGFGWGEVGRAGVGEGCGVGGGGEGGRSGGFCAGGRGGFGEVGFGGGGCAGMGAGAGLVSFDVRAEGEGAAEDN